MNGVVVLAAAVLLSALLAVLLKARNGRFSTHRVSELVEPTERLTAEMIGAPLGRDVTLVQFSSAFCAPCRATRVILTDVAATVDGVEAVEIDAESHLNLVRRLNILRTPTVLVLDSAGAIRTRASGLPTRNQVLTAVAANM